MLCDVIVIDWDKKAQSSVSLVDFSMYVSVELQ